MVNMADSEDFKIIFNKEVISALEIPNAASSGGFLLSLACSTTKELFVAARVAAFDLEHLDLELENVFRIIPGGLDMFGIYLKCSEASSAEQVLKQCKDILPLVSLQEDLNGSFFVLALGNNSEVGLYTIRSNNTIVEEAYSTSEQNIFTSCLKFRLRGQLSVNFDLAEEKEELENNLESEFRRINSHLHSLATAFYFPALGAIVSPVTWSTLDPQQPCKELVQAAGDSMNRKLHQLGDYSQDVIDVELLRQLTGEPGSANSVLCAPIIHHEHKRYNTVTMMVKLDVVVYMHCEEKMKYLPEKLMLSVVMQMGCMCQTTSMYSMPDDVKIPEVFHFHPAGLSHMVTVVYCKNTQDDQLASERQLFHMLMNLPQKRPLFRRRNAFLWPEDIKKLGYVLNIHLNVKPPVSIPGQLYTVSGNYTYHHYMQDNINDDKWGCAYRSLQTIISWYRLQGFTDRPIPTHKTIQEILVKIGDKQPNIIGSKTWIGSMEVSYVLENLLGVTSKILHAPTGADVVSKGRELAMHFQTQGTPVMIGGGVLAHTILGVFFDEATGDTRFLILDPHYNGAEDIKTIVDKGWCGWKGPKFWDSPSHYNLCLPQCPVGI